MRERERKGPEEKSEAAASAQLSAVRSVLFTR